MSDYYADYKDIPCRRCGRVWKWSLDGKSKPYCLEGYGCAKFGSGEVMGNDAWLARKVEAWYRATYNAACKARGNPDTILDGMPTDLIITLARNDIHLVYKGGNQ